MTLPIETILIPTRLRPRLLERLVSELDDRAAAAGGTPRVVVVDDIDPGEALECGAPPQAATRALRYERIDSVARVRLIDRLCAKTGIERSLWSSL